MRGKVKIGETEVEMLANAASPIIYRQIFHKDFLRMLQEIQTEGNEAIGVSLFEEMGFCMSMQAVKPLSELGKLNESDYIEWLSQFEANALMLAAVDIANLYNGQETGLSKAKKEEG